MIEVYLYIGAQNKSGGITDEEYVILCNMNGELLTVSSKSEYESTDTSELSHQIAGSWLGVEFSKLMTPAWKDWQEYSGEDLEDIINSKATTIRDEVKSSETTQLSESESSEDVLNMEDFAYDLMKACNDDLYDTTEDFYETYSIPNLKEFFSLDSIIGPDYNAIAVVLCNNENDLDQALSAFRDNIKYNMEMYDYDPIEAEKLENAIIKTKGLYAVLCICDDYSKANSILQEYGFD